MDSESKVYRYWVICLYAWAIALLTFDLIFRNASFFGTFLIFSQIFYLSFNCICFYIQSRSKFTWKLLLKFILQISIIYILGYGYYWM